MERPSPPAPPLMAWLIALTVLAVADPGAGFPPASGRGALDWVARHGVLVAATVALRWAALAICVGWLVAVGVAVVGHRTGHRSLRRIEVLLGPRSRRLARRIAALGISGLLSAPTLPALASPDPTAPPPPTATLADPKTAPPTLRLVEVVAGDEQPPTLVAVDGHSPPSSSAAAATTAPTSDPVTTTTTTGTPAAQAGATTTNTPTTSTTPTTTSTDTADATTSDPAGATTATRADATTTSPPTTSTTPTTPAAPSSGISTADAPTRPVERPGSGLAPWVIRPGEHLWLVAEGTMTDGRRRSVDVGAVARYHRALLDANADTLPVPGNPDLVFPGTVVVRPDPAPFLA